jgi:probable F420-dependent oxidoreductase
MDFGVHLPLIGFEEKPFSFGELLAYVQDAEKMGFAAVAANDHLLFSRPWLDGPAALAAVAASSGSMALMTTVALPVIRGPVALAKSLAAVDIFSGGRLIAGVSAGSSRRDYEAVGIPFEERWKRLDEAVVVMRRLWQRDGEPFAGMFYNTEGITLEPYPVQQPPPIWIGSWGSATGLRRTALLADGWLASAYNTTPERFAEGWRALQDALQAFGRDAEQFPNAIATMLLYVTEDKHRAEYMIREVIAPTLGRAQEELASRLLVGSAAECAQKLAAYQEVGVQRVFVWPVADEREQLAIFQRRVLSLLR